VATLTDGDSNSAVSPALGDRQLVSFSFDNQIFSSFTHNNTDDSAAAACSCTNSIFHLFFCPVPFSKRVSLHFTTPSSVLPRNQCSFNVNHVMSQRMTSLSGASDAQKQLINVGSNVARASCCKSHTDNLRRDIRLTEILQDQ
jgi:hypothetical protein